MKEFISLAKVSKLLLLTLMLSLCQSSFSRNFQLITNISDSNFDTEIKPIEGEKPWLLVFYMSGCPYCTKALSALEKIRRHNIGLETRFGMIDCNENIYSCYRFNVTRVPTIVIIDQGKMFLPEIKMISETSLYQFIKEEKSIDEAVEVPKTIGMLSLVFRSFEEAIRYMNDFFQYFVNTHLGMTFKWQTTYSIGILLILLALIIAIEVIVITFCCNIGGAKKKKRTSEIEMVSQSQSQESENTENIQNSSAESESKEETDKLISSTNDNRNKQAADKINGSEKDLKDRREKKE